MPLTARDVAPSGRRYDTARRLWRFPAEVARARRRDALMSPAFF